jgi:KaiC/GvpD/RAD55 family RecA-like ATPase
LLFGGFPKGYAVAFVSPSTDEREAIVQSFVETGARAGETTFFLTTDPNNGKGLAEKYPENFYLFVCNLQAEATVNATPNVFRLKGVESLTDIDIALTRAFRTLKPSLSDSRRICIEAISDILLQHHATTTRKWLSAFLPNLRKNGFTMLAVVDPQIHSNEELQAVLGVFDGEIRVTEKETPEGTKQKLKVRKLINQRYSDEEIILSKETLAK